MEKQLKQEILSAAHSIACLENDMSSAHRLSCSEDNQFIELTIFPILARVRELKAEINRVNLIAQGED